MIEEKLEEARLRSARLRMQIIVVLLAIACLVGLVVFGLTVIDFSRKSEVPIAAEETATEQEERRAPSRSLFKQELQRYENDEEPRLRDVGVEEWNRNALFEISEIQKEMMLKFTNGEYDKALTNLRSLNEKTSSVLSTAQAIYTDSITKASVFLADDSSDKARLHIDKALMVAPHSSEALALQEEIEKLRLVLPLLENAAVARIENDLEKEYSILQQVAELNKGRTDVNERITVLAQEIQERQFSSHISKGFAAVDEKRVKEARYHYRQAKKIAPKRAELAALFAQLSALEKTLRYQNHLAEAERAIRQDNWPQAYTSLEKAAQEEPGSKRVVEGLRRADMILGLLKKFEQYFADPYRLTEPDVLIGTEKMLEQAENYSEYSFTLQQQSARLQYLMVKTNRIIPVTITSDNTTDIQVRRVGKVGTVVEKTIHLKPGRYTFEGSRPGYKSELMHVFISYDENSFSVHIVCDEPI